MSERRAGIGHLAADTPGRLHSHVRTPDPARCASMGEPWSEFPGWTGYHPGRARSCEEEPAGDPTDRGAPMPPSRLIRACRSTHPNAPYHSPGAEIATCGPDNSPDAESRAQFGGRPTRVKLPALQAPTWTAASGNRRSRMTVHHVRKPRLVNRSRRPLAQSVLTRSLITAGLLSLGLPAGAAGSGTAHLLRPPGDHHRCGHHQRNAR